MSDSLQIGKIAPNFVSVGVYKNRLGKIRLSDYHGKKYVILIFYPANFTSVSPTELIQLSERISEFRRLSTQILGISVDSPFFIITTKSRWIGAIKLPFDLRFKPNHNNQIQIVNKGRAFISRCFYH
jgi:alkyl hydroperoxide reductase subunit AhpC